MPVRAHITHPPRLDEAALAPWRKIPTVMASDCLAAANSSRGGAMAGRIGPLDGRLLTAGETIVGQARTADCPLGDHSALKAAVAWIEPGDIIVADAKAHNDCAMMGDIVALWARELGCKGFVVDGAVRDAEQLIGVGLPVFCTGLVPRRPRAGHIGEINGTISCGGVLVAPGDLVLADRDGVVIVPLEDREQCLEKALEKMDDEQVIIAALERGESLQDITPAILIEPV